MVTLPNLRSNSRIFLDPWYQTLIPITTEVLTVSLPVKEIFPFSNMTAIGVARALVSVRLVPLDL